MNPTKQKHLKIQIVVLAKENKNYYLLLLKTNERRGSFWQNITGSLEKDESFEEAAHREFLEETGISAAPIQEEDLSLDFTFEDQWKRDVYEKTYMYLLDHRYPIKIEPHEHSDYRWINVQEVKPDAYKFPSNYKTFCKALKHV